MGPSGPIPLNFASAAGAAVIFFFDNSVTVALGRAITGIVIVEGLDAQLVRGQQIFQQQLHWHLVAFEAGRIVVGIR